MKIKKIINVSEPSYHYYGWGSIIDTLSQRVKLDNNGIILHTFTDCIFWPNKKRALPKEPWIGFVHSAIKNQPSRPKKSYCIDGLIESDEFQRSLLFCKGLITLSDYTKKYLESKLDIPIHNCFLPKKTESNFFNFSDYFDSPIISHSGFELRDISKFYLLKTSFKKQIFVNQKHNLDLISKELSLNNLKLHNENINIVFKNLSNKEYIKKLTSSIGFSYYYDCGASHSIIEHIMSHSPLVVNKIPPIVEYLGEDYPMYYENISHNLDRYLLDKTFVQQTSDYLKQQSQRKEFTIDYFYEFVNQL